MRDGMHVMQDIDIPVHRSRSILAHGSQRSGSSLVRSGMTK